MKSYKCYEERNKLCSIWYLLLTKQFTNLLWSILGFTLYRGKYICTCFIYLYMTCKQCIVVWWIRNSRDWRNAKSFYFASNTRQCHIWLDTLVNNWYTITHPSSVKGLSAQSFTICLRRLDPSWFIGLDTIRCAICHCWGSGPLKAIVNQK